MTLKAVPNESEQGRGRLDNLTQFIQCITMKKRMETMITMIKMKYLTLKGRGQVNQSGGGDGPHKSRYLQPGGDKGSGGNNANTKFAP